MDLDEVKIDVERLDEGRTIKVTLSSDFKITMHEFCVELEQYLLQVSRAARERVQLGADN